MFQTFMPSLFHGFAAPGGQIAASAAASAIAATTISALHWAIKKHQKLPTVPSV